MRLRIALLLAVMAAGPAGAHAILERASPPVGGVVSRPPAEIRLWFSERIEPRFSRARLATAAGTTVAAGSAVSGKQLVLHVPPLAPGSYRVTWSVVSVDTHKTEGSFTFEVRP
ncbi:MAG TPA: copper resistance protein CopC [Xanthobacteraceae bacterium]|nr:copper resistance protein CopC [Xanthobacteraceae bacterium]